MFWDEMPKRTVFRYFVHHCIVYCPRLSEPPVGLRGREGRSKKRGVRLLATYQTPPGRLASVAAIEWAGHASLGPFWPTSL